MMTQLQNFVESQNLPREDLDTASNNPSPENASTRREPIKHLLIGSPKTVSSTIHYLQVIGYASIGDWSPLLPTTNPGEVMSILVRQILMP
ncbi:hypothetical protein [Nodularia sp. NIES-3585]|uniref:hypothetical protein n=1 Tax=Nodularia sp. NIES-3585 TaxID=1973477 RepID=UPI000B5CF2AD|nr:hypothetical protein [Nodularia sp. NIES-3585]GAX37118.1 hypothetical protein NIES3585_31590 [Nodularia sp. NIES-3585]